MTEGEPEDRLSAKRQFVLVLRVVVDEGGKVAGELVDPLSKRRQRFTRETLVGAIRAWIDEVLTGTAQESSSQRKTRTSDT
ncbi:hypothetical protein GORHZ_247_00290 [Gordonia rhizosphera NBRC 16068]|uniref:Uncharacterized protein n=1 Tax=Gordonia rhizosphera NBRC 16068 TaxID=1108045 RepID=K6WJE5_9ACTN|nr:hypothetical protein GORHZ_247_00290 [Gordonia rhizosphera NBRC 16068]